MVIAVGAAAAASSGVVLFTASYGVAAAVSFLAYSSFKEFEEIGRNLWDIGDHLTGNLLSKGSVRTEAQSQESQVLYDKGTTTLLEQCNQSEEEEICKNVVEDKKVSLFSFAYFKQLIYGSALTKIRPEGSVINPACESMVNRCVYQQNIPQPVCHQLVDKCVELTEENNLSPQDRSNLQARVINEQCQQGKLTQTYCQKMEDPRVFNNQVQDIGIIEGVAKTAAQVPKGAWGMALFSVGALAGGVVYKVKNIVNKFLKPLEEKGSFGVASAQMSPSLRKVSLEETLPNSGNLKGKVSAESETKRAQALHTPSFWQKVVGGWQSFCMWLRSFFLNTP